MGNMSDTENYLAHDFVERTNFSSPDENVIPSKVIFLDTTGPLFFLLNLFIVYVNLL